MSKINKAPKKTVKATVPSAKGKATVAKQAQKTKQAPKPKPANTNNNNNKAPAAGQAVATAPTTTKPQQEKKKGKKQQQTPQNKTPIEDKLQVDSDDDDDDDEVMKFDDDDKKPAVQTTPKTPPKPTTPKQTTPKQTTPKQTPPKQTTPKQGTKRKQEDNNNAVDTSISPKKIKTSENGSKPSPGKNSSSDSGSLYINNLSNKTTIASLRSFVEKVAKVTNVRIPAYNVGTSRGYAYVDVSSGFSESLKLTGQTLDGKKIKVSEKQASVEKPERKTDEASVFIGNLKYTTSDEAIKNEMSKFGTVVNLRVVRHKGNERSKGFGYCDFEKVESAKAAVAKSEQITIDDRKIVIDSAERRKEEETK